MRLAAIHRAYRALKKLLSELRVLAGSLPPKLLIGYILVGVLGVSTNLIALRFAIVLNVPQIPALTWALFCAVAVQFLCHRYFVFRGAVGSIARQGAAFMIPVAVSWFITVTLVGTITHFTKIGTFNAQLFAIPVVTPIGFLLNRFLVFKQH